MSDTIRDGVTDLYRFFGAGDELLYIGISFSAVVRASSHRQDKSWWREVVRMDVERFPSRQDAACAEAAAIRSERPKYNITYNDGGHSLPAPHSDASAPAGFAGRVFAFGIPGGSCPVGYVRRSWGSFDRPLVEVALYRWDAEQFGNITTFIEVGGGMELMEAEPVVGDGGVVQYDMEPLREFQSVWVDRMDGDQFTLFAWNVA